MTNRYKTPQEKRKTRDCKSCGVRHPKTDQYWKKYTYNEKEIWICLTSRQKNNEYRRNKWATDENYRIKHNDRHKARNKAKYIPVSERDDTGRKYRKS